MHLRIIQAPLGKWFYQLAQKEYMGNPVCNKEAEANHRCLITLNAMCLGTTAKHETFRTCHLMIASS